MSVRYCIVLEHWFSLLLYEQLSLESNLVNADSRTTIKSSNVSKFYATHSSGTSIWPIYIEYSSNVRHCQEGDLIHQHSSPHCYSNQAFTSKVYCVPSCVLSTPAVTCCSAITEQCNIGRQ